MGTTQGKPPPLFTPGGYGYEERQPTYWASSAMTERDRREQAWLAEVEKQRVLLPPLDRPPGPRRHDPHPGRVRELEAAIARAEQRGR